MNIARSITFELQILEWASEQAEKQDKSLSAYINTQLKLLKIKQDQKENQT